MFIHDLVMVADVMTTQLHILYVDVVVIVVDVMTTQDVYTIWQMLQPIVLDAELPYISMYFSFTANT